MNSLEALQSATTESQVAEIALDVQSSGSLIEGHRLLVNGDFETLVAALQRDHRYRWLKLGGLRPFVSPTSLLACLSSCSNLPTSPAMMEAISHYGVRITELQRLIRIESALVNNHYVRLRDEIRNSGHQEWEPKDYPSWLLIEIEANVLIRVQQCQVALEMNTPSSGTNSLLQLNMGQGKSSLIIPMIASFLADTKRIMRVIVPRALLLQMGNILATRLSGLLRHPLRHIPWSRKIPTDSKTITAFKQSYIECLQNRGVILALPEHLLSFRLSGRERLSCGNVTEAMQMIEAQNWLDTIARDVLDESDHTLAVKTQLVYTIGAQWLVDGHPNRWKTCQDLLHLVKQCLKPMRKDHPQGLKLTEKRRGGFPTVHILRKEIEDVLIYNLTMMLINGDKSILAMQGMSTNAAADIMEFLTDSELENSKALDHLKDDFGKKDLLLLRGLLLSRILILALSKRWNVNYGQHPTRCLIAVPYLGKGVSSMNSEFGHPDVSILLTCLTYYYSGLTKNQMLQSLIKLLSFDDPALVYDTWVTACGDLPASLRSWTSINVDDSTQVEILWGYLAYTMDVVDHYLNYFVFPKEAKQFEKKLVSNALDLVLTGTILAQPSIVAQTSGSTISHNDSRLGLAARTIREDFCLRPSNNMTYRVLHIPMQKFWITCSNQEIASMYELKITTASPLR